LRLRPRWNFLVVSLDDDDDDDFDLDDFGDNVCNIKQKN